MGTNKDQSMAVGSISSFDVRIEGTGATAPFASVSSSIKCG